MIKIQFSGMTGNFDPQDNFITNILKKRYEIQISDNPDYLFYSVNSKDYLKYHCIRIYFTPENLVPDFNICDYAIGFHYIDFEDRYIRYPLYLNDSFRAYTGDDYATDLKRAQEKHLNALDYFDKDAFCAFVYSNAESAECRGKIFNALGRYKKVDSGGGYLNNIGGRVENKTEFQSKYKFVLAFENTSTSGYTSEKIVHAFSAGAIPIYWGNPEIEKEFNKNSFINCHRFGLNEKGERAAIDSIVKEVIRLDHDNVAFEKMLKTPAFTEKNNVNEQTEMLENFLYHIIDQDYEKAFRRNRFYWGERYERKQRIGNQFYWICRIIIPIRDMIKNILK